MMKRGLCVHHKPADLDHLCQCSSEANPKRQGIQLATNLDQRSGGAEWSGGAESDPRHSYEGLIGAVPLHINMAPKRQGPEGGAIIHGHVYMFTTL